MASKIAEDAAREVTEYFCGSDCTPLEKRQDAANIIAPIDRAIREGMVARLREEARKAKAAREGLTEHGAQTHSRWMRLHFRETDYAELADRIEQEASDGD